MANARMAARRAEVERNDRALLRAAREILAEHGTHASVAAIAGRAGVGIGTLYRRYRTKEELFQHLCVVTLTDYLHAAEEGLARSDPWEGLEYFVTSAVLAGTGALGPVAGTIEVTRDMAELGAAGDTTAEQVIDRAHAAGVLRADVSAVDISLLIEQLGRSPLVEQIGRQSRADLVDAARRARHRLIAITLDGLRGPAASALPGPQPGWELFSERWSHGDGR